MKKCAKGCEVQQHGMTFQQKYYMNTLLGRYSQNPLNLNVRQNFHNNLKWNKKCKMAGKKISDAFESHGARTMLARRS